MSYLKELKLSLLEAGGVDNWSGYGDAIEYYMEENDLDDLTASEKLEALENLGVDNWSYYGESLDYYSAYVDYYNSNDGESLMNFEEFVKMEHEKEKELERFAEDETSKQEEKLKAKLKAQVADTPEEELIHKTLFTWLKTNYPDLSDIEVRNAYFNLLKVKGPYQEQHKLFNAQFKQAKAYAKTQTTKIREFLVIASTEYIELVVKTPKFKDFVDSVIVTDDKELIEEMYKKEKDSIK